MQSGFCLKLLSRKPENEFQPNAASDRLVLAGYLIMALAVYLYCWQVEDIFNHLNIFVPHMMSFHTIGAMFTSII